MKKSDSENARIKATASDVAKLAGVSKWTVSRAFIPGAPILSETRERILAAADSLGYRPNLLARSLSQKRTHIIGVTVDETKNPNMTLLLDEVTRQLQERGYMALLLNISDKQKYNDVMSLAYQLQVDGILFMATWLTAELADVARTMHHVPLVQIGRSTENPGIDIVSIDGHRAGSEIADLLLAQGHQRFGYMKGPDTASSHLMRFDGYRDRLVERGKVLDVHLIVGSYDKIRGYQTMVSYLDSVPPEQWVEAMFCENDILAIGALQAIHDRPGCNIAIVGFDNIDEAADPHWQLTSYDQRKDRLIHEAINRLINKKRTDQGAWRYGELIVRGSHRKA
ncbi:LacI family DNA-binding transcriptional regulator [Candidatus Pantoea multigeneris]|uniref:LacI family DNA-binding transcriptional regulator n=1 Tax=Candidatus Pantoea multigeneris TaxID=2608357 RepID=A0ABX0R7I6_9GAMM|nr:LacI family DNA-binding transcriptional regulator [Pantoea multigeneris]NIF21320.1 LacI family DNA-binding transcriptional regulator [Pantoea multigeneris]